MANELQKNNIDECYSSVIRENKTDEIIFDTENIDIPVATELYERTKQNHKAKIQEMKVSFEYLLEKRAEYFKSLREKLAQDIEIEYGKLDGEVEVASEKAYIIKDNKMKLLESKIEIIDDFRESEKEMLLIIDESIKVEKGKQVAGASSWDNLAAFIADIKAKTLPSFKQRREVEIDPLLEEVNKFKEEIRELEKGLLVTTEKINVFYSKRLLTLNKEYKQEELRVLGLHRRTLKYLEVQSQISKENVKRIWTILEKLTLQRNQKNEEMKKKILVERKQLLLEFSSNLDSEFDDLESTMDSFKKIESLQENMKKLSSLVREGLVNSTSQITKSDSLMLENIVARKEGDK